MNVLERQQQILDTWKTDWSEMPRAEALTAQEKWGVMTTYLSLLTLIPAAVSAIFNPVIGGTLIAADVAVGVAGWIRSRRSLDAVEQETLARHL